MGFEIMKGIRYVQTKKPVILEMKNVGPFVFILLSIYALGCASSLDLRERDIDVIMHEYSPSTVPGAAILVMKNDTVLMSKAYGMANLDDHEPVTTSTNFRLASLTKQFTATCIMMLTERGQLSYDDTLGGLFPEFPSYGKGISIRHLLQHTSGLRDYESLIPDSQTVQVKDADCFRLLEGVDSLEFPSGQKFQYSNTGYAFLALIVEKVSGQRFADFLRDNIFDPIGMKTSVAFEDGISTVVNRAFGYSQEQGSWVRTDQSVTSAVLGDGGIYSNVSELSRWVSALYHHKLVSAETQGLGWTMGKLNDGTSIDYGFGWHLETYRGRIHPYHGGSTIGFRNNIQLFPEDQLMVVILTNRNEGDPGKQARQIADLFLHD